MTDLSFGCVVMVLSHVAVVLTGTLPSGRHERHRQQQGEEGLQQHCQSLCLWEGGAGLDGGSKEILSERKVLELPEKVMYSGILYKGLNQEFFLQFVIVSYII